MATSRITGTNEHVLGYHHEGGYDHDDLDDWELDYDVDVTACWKVDVSNFGGSSPYFQAGENLTFSNSGCTGTFVDTDESGWLIFVHTNATDPNDSDTITGGISGDTCDTDDWNLYQSSDGLSPVLECHKGYHDTGSAVVMAGATCNATYRRIIRPVSADMHSGIPETDGSIVCIVPDIANGIAFDIQESHSSIQDLFILWENEDAGSLVAMKVQGGTNVIIGCMVKAYTPNGSGYGIAVSVNTGTLIINCLVYECRNDNVRLEIAANVYNSTAIDAGDDNFDDTGAAATLKNCLSDNAGDDDYETPGTLVTCGSSDLTGSVGLRSQNYTFVNAGIDDYHLAVGSDGIEDGTDVSGDGYGDDDIDFYTRPYDTDWDIGFDEYAPAATSLPPTSLPPTSLPPTSLPPTSLPPTSLPPTSLAPTSLPPTSLPPTSLPPTSLAPTSLPPTSLPPTSLPPTSIPPTSLPPTTPVVTTLAPPTTIGPTTLPPTPAPTTPSPVPYLRRGHNFLGISVRPKWH